MTDKPDLMGMFFSDEAMEKIDEAEFLRALGEMRPEDFTGVLIRLLQMWGKAAAHCAFNVIIVAPESRDEITNFIRVACRCAAIEGALEHMMRAAFLVEPDPTKLEHSVDMAYEMVRRNQCRK